MNLVFKSSTSETQFAFSRPVLKMNRDMKLIVELLASHNDNCTRVEKHALHAVFSLEIAVFNGLRDISPFNLHLALHKMDEWFGKVRTIEHSVCLVVLTDYISCAFNQRTFYKTFDNALTQKFIDTLFLKLYDEWIKVFSKHNYIRFSNSELESIQKSLMTSVSRFPESFRHKHLLNRILKLSLNYRSSMLEMNFPAMNCDSSKSHLEPHKMTSTKCHLLRDTTNVMEKKRIISDMQKYVVRKTHVNEDSTTNDGIIESSVDNINKNPTHLAQMESIPKEEKIMNTVNVDGDRNWAPKTAEVIVDLTCESGDSEMSTDVQRNISVASKPKKLNAFDVLMRKVNPPKRKFIC